MRSVVKVIACSAAMGVYAFSVPAANVQTFVPLLFELFQIRDLAIERHPLELLIRQIFQSGQAPAQLSSGEPKA